jgi:outer membrane protein
MPIAAALTLAGAVKFALSHSPTIAKQVAVVSQMEASYVKARSQTLPGLTGQLGNQVSKSANFQGSFGVIGASQASVFSQNTASLGTSYTFNGGLSHYLSLSARQQYEQAQADLRRAEQQVASNVANAYFGLAAKDEVVRLDESDLRYQRTLEDVAKAKERAGVAAGVDVLSAQAAEEKSRYTLASAQADAANASESLAQIIGAPLETAFDVPAQIAQPALPSQPVESLIAIAQATRPDVASARDAVAIAQTNRRSADTDLFPQIQTYANIGNQFSPTLYPQELAQAEALNASRAAAGLPPLPLPSRGSPGFWNVGVNTTISVPFLDWGARRANHRNLNEQIAAAQVNLGAVKTQAEIDVRQSYRAAQTALAQVASAQEESRYASEAARIAQLQYTHGVIGLVDVQQREQNALSAQVDLYDARVAYVNAIVNLRVATGVRMPQEAVADL